MPILIAIAVFLLLVIARFETLWFGMTLGMSAILIISGCLLSVRKLPQRKNSRTHPWYR
jgi:hypothetical protein